MADLIWSGSTPGHHRTRSFDEEPASIGALPSSRRKDSDKPFRNAATIGPQSLLQFDDWLDHEFRRVGD